MNLTCQQPPTIAQGRIFASVECPMALQRGHGPAKAVLKRFLSVINPAQNAFLKWFQLSQEVAHA